jgi:hypothetical protein
VTEQKIVLAIVQSKTKHIDQYWISPEITAYNSNTPPKEQPAIAGFFSP